MADNHRTTISYIYDKLAQNDNDVLGHIVYSVYKKQKIAEIKRTCAKQGTDCVEAKNLIPFVELSQTDEQIDFYKQRADTLVNAFLDSYLKGELETRVKELESEYKDKYEHLAADCKRNWFYGFWQSFAASAALTVVTVLLLLSLVINKVGWKAIGEILDTVYTRLSQNGQPYCDAANLYCGKER